MKSVRGLQNTSRKLCLKGNRPSNLFSLVKGCFHSKGCISDGTSSYGIGIGSSNIWKVIQVLEQHILPSRQHLFQQHNVKLRPASLTTALFHSRRVRVLILSSTIKNREEDPGLLSNYNHQSHRNVSLQDCWTLSLSQQSCNWCRKVPVMLMKLHYPAFLVQSCDCVLS